MSICSHCGIEHGDQMFCKIYNLYDSEGIVDEVEATCIDEARDYFEDNFDKEFLVRCHIMIDGYKKGVAFYG